MFFLDTLFPPESDIELLDINPQLQWLVGDYADESNKVDLSKGTPWHAQCYTQVASGKLVLRQKLEGRDLDMYAPKTWLVRIVEPFEAMNILGLCDIKHWLPPSTDHAWRAQALEDLLNLAGNAFLHVPLRAVGVRSACDLGEVQEAAFSHRATSCVCGRQP